MMETSVLDIVIPYFNGLPIILPCLKSVADHTECGYRLYIMNDGSDDFVVRTVDEKIREWFSDLGIVEHVSSGENRGYLASVNDGIQRGSSEFVVLVNSDVVLTAGWDRGLLECLASSEKIGIASPLSNHANFTRFGMPEGWDIHQTAQGVRRYSERTYPDIGIASGFCLIASRRLYQELGLYDPVYGRGYFEESDLCLRAIERGYRVVADDATFVYHKGWATFQSSGRNHWLETNEAIFKRRWGRAHDFYKERFLEKRPFDALKMALEDSNALNDDSLPRRARREEVRQRDRVDQEQRLADKKAGRPPWKPRKPGILDTYKLFTKERWHSIQKESDKLGKESVSLKLTSKPRVLFLLPGFGSYGGVLSVVQLANRLLDRGFECQLVVRSSFDPGSLRESLYMRPVSAPRLEVVWTRLPPADFVVSTRWDTVFDALLLQRRWGCRLVSFVQDFEPDFFDPSDPRREIAGESLKLVDRKVVKSDWLRDRLKPFGGSVSKIPLGLDLNLFYPADERPNALRVVSAARPKAAFRNFPGTLRVLRRLVQERPSVEVVLYGQPVPDDYGEGVEFSHRGVLSQSEVTQLLRSASAVLDISLFQGFGRPGLEAMACGVPSVLTTRGGISEYARDGENCIQVDPEDEDGAVSGLVRLLDDARFAAKLTKKGLETASQFNAELEADRWMALLNSTTC